jgi:NADH-quinone oxidoreductase subunit J
MMATIALYFFSLIAAISSVGMLFIRNVFHGALLLITVLLAIAGIYVLALAEMIAVTQILVYAGGIVVVIIFAMMLTTPISGKPLRIGNGSVIAGALLGVSIFGVMIYLISKESFTAPLVHQPSSLRQFGIALMTDYALPFETAGIVLLMSLVGAAVVASNASSKKI